MVKTVTIHVEDSTTGILNLPLPPDLPKGPLDIVMVIVPSIAPKVVDGMAGRWRTYFPAEFDLDNALHEIRHAWEKKWAVDE